MPLSKDDFNRFNQVTHGEILEDIDHRVRCGVPIREACREIVEELTQVEQHLKADTIRKAFMRWKNVPKYKESVAKPRNLENWGQISVEETP